MKAAVEAAYRVLRVAPNASDEEIEKAWRTRIRETYPGVNKGDLGATQLVAEINSARDRIFADRAENRAAQAEREARQEEQRAQQQAQAPSAAAASQFGDSLRGEPRQPTPEPAPPPSPPPPAPEAESYKGRRLANMLLAACVAVGGYLLMTIAEANQRHDEITPGQSTGHYSGEFFVALLAFLLVLAGGFLFLRELWQLFTNEKPPYGS